MPKAVLLKIDGTYEKVEPKTLEEYQKYVGGYVELLQIRRGYVNPHKKEEGRFNLVCYVNEDGLAKQMGTNPWAGLLSVLGVTLWAGLYIHGPILVFSEDKSHEEEESDIDPYILELVEQHIAVEDEDAFFVALEELNEPPPKETKRKRPNEEVKEYVVSLELCLIHLEKAKYYAPQEYHGEIDAIMKRMWKER